MEVHTLPDSVAVNNIRVYSVHIIEVHALPASVAVMVDGGLVPASLTATSVIVYCASIVSVL